MSDVAQGREAALVLFDGDYPRSTFEEQRACEATWPWTDLDQGRSFERSRDARDAAGEVEIEQKILAEALARAKPGRADDVAQRRKPVERVQGLAPARACMAS